MRPEKLTFSGLRSYYGTAEVDFTDLGLFAIIGDTGAVPELKRSAAVSAHH